MQRLGGPWRLLGWGEGAHGGPVGFLRLIPARPSFPKCLPWGEVQRKRRWRECIPALAGPGAPHPPAVRLPPAPAAPMSSQAGYLCFLSADGNGSDTCKMSSINKCRGLIAQWALAQEAARTLSCLFHLWLRGAGTQEACVRCRRGAWRPPSIFLVQGYLLSTNWSPSWQLSWGFFELRPNPLRTGEKVTGCIAQGQRRRGKAVSILETSPQMAGLRTKPSPNVTRSHCSSWRHFSPEKVGDAQRH